MTSELMACRAELKEKHDRVMALMNECLALRAAVRDAYVKHTVKGRGDHYQPVVSQVLAEIMQDHGIGIEVDDG